MSAHVLQGTLVLPDRLVPSGQVVVEDGIIEDVVEVEGRYRPTLDVGENLVAPGFIDVHVHGIAGADTMDASPESLSRMMERFAAHGVTSALPTTMTASTEAIIAALQAVHAYRHSSQDRDRPRAQVLGVHLEGPWISPKFKGAQNERQIVPPEPARVEAILAAADAVITKVTIAPEQPGGWEAIRTLRSHRVYVSIGHTAATFAQALRAIDLGATHVTHCYNAMTGLHHREPGVLGAALVTDDLYAELIADGVHVHPAAMQLLIRTKGRDGVMLITDAMAATERPDGEYELGGQPVFVRNGEARLADGSLAGSTLVLDQAIRNMVRLCGVPLVDAIYMASATPASAIGLGQSKGRIRTGFDADLVVLDRRLCPSAVMIAGRFSPLHGSAA